MDNSVLTARQITKNYTIGDSVLEVLKGVDLELRQGEIIAIVGKSGAGKSTLLHVMGLLDQPTSGELFYHGEPVNGKSQVELARLRNSRVGFIFQFHHLLPEFTTLENVLMPALIAGKNHVAGVRRAEYLLERVGLSLRLKHRPGELSGGELQRVAVARALVNEPSIVLADEPSGNLDHHNSTMLHELIWGLARENNYSFVIVTHDLSLARQADRVLHLSEGIIHELDRENIHEHFFL